MLLVMPSGLSASPASTAVWVPLTSRLRSFWQYWPSTLT
jgi:hypothetical protein